MGTRDRLRAAALGGLRLAVGAPLALALVAILAVTLASSRAEVPSPVPWGAGREASSAPTEVARVAEESSAAKVPSAENAALEALTAKYGKECISSGSITVSFPRTIAHDLEKQIDAAALGGIGWIKEGKLWLGDLESAIEAFGAVEAFQDDEEVWVMLETEIGLVARLMHPIDSESGKTTWMLLDQAAKCGSADPASDDED